MKLSIPMMVKNESKYLSECLHSLRPLLEQLDCELIIVDTGSEDDTVEIAKQFTDKVFFHPWNHDFSEMRNITLSYAVGEWVLIIDGDEVLVDAMPIINFLNNPKATNFNTGLIAVKNIMDENDPTNVSLFSSPRIFKNNGIKYSGAVHNQSNHKAPYYEIPSSIIHYGYMSTDKALMDKKFERTSKIILNELEKNPDNIYMLYQLSVSYGMHFDHELAVPPIEKAYQLIQNLDKELYIYIYLHLIKVYINAKHFEKAEIIADEALEVSKEYIDIYYYGGKMKFLHQKYEESLTYYLEYLKILKSNSANKPKKDVTVIHYALEKYELVHFDMVLIYAKLNKFDKALEHYNQIETLQIKSGLAIEIIPIMVQTQSYTLLEEYYNEVIMTFEEKNILQFEALVENQKINMSIQEKVELEDAFASLKSRYHFLNLVKSEERKGNDDLNRSLLESYSFFNFSELPAYYGNALYYLLKRKESITRFFKVRNIDALRNHISYLTKAFPKFSEYALAYLEANNKDEITELYVNKEIAKHAMLVENISDNLFERLFDFYILNGIKWVKLTYNDIIFEDKISDAFLTDEDEFLYYIWRASLDSSNKKTYLEALQSAMDVYPLMRGITYLKDKILKEKNNEISEFDQLLKQLKENIKTLIDQKNYNEAISLIRQCETFAPKDAELLLFETEIEVKKIEDGIL